MSRSHLSSGLQGISGWSNSSPTQRRRGSQRTKAQTQRHQAVEPSTRAKTQTARGHQSAQVRESTTKLVNAKVDLFRRRQAARQREKGVYGTSPVSADKSNVKQVLRSLQRNNEPLRFRVQRLSELGTRRDSLIIFDTVQETLACLDAEHDRDSPKKHMPLSQIPRVEKSADDKHRVIVVFYGPERPYDVVFPDEGTRDFFIDELCTIQPSIALISNTSLCHAPKWIPDSETERCMRCDEPFTVTNRRHHCRSCGYVVCGPCSSKQAVMPELGYEKPERVCDHCFATIRTMRTAAMLANTPKNGPAKTPADVPPLSPRLQISALEEDKPERDVYGFLVQPSVEDGQDALSVSQTNHLELRRQQRVRYLARLEVQRQRWNSFIVLHTSLEKSPELKKLVRKGVPPELRGHIWQVLSGSKARQKAAPRTYYQDLLLAAERQPPKVHNEIRKDLRRTFPGHLVYETKEGLGTLERVLLAYSVHNPQIGYCQSMNFICALVLLFMEEEDAFWMLVTVVEHVAAVKPPPGSQHISTLGEPERETAIISARLATPQRGETQHLPGSTSPDASSPRHRYHTSKKLDKLKTNFSSLRQSLNQTIFTKLLHAGGSTEALRPDAPTEERHGPILHAIPSTGFLYHATNLAGVHIDQAVFVDLLAEKLPRVANRLRKLDVPIESLTINWFMCLFVNSLPLETVLHIWDCVFSEGIKVLFRAALAVMKLHERSILHAHDLEDVLNAVKPNQQIQGNVYASGRLDSHEFMQLCFDDLFLGSFPMRRIHELRAKHSILVYDRSRTVTRPRRRPLIMRSSAYEKSLVPQSTLTEAKLDGLPVPDMHRGMPRPPRRDEELPLPLKPSPGRGRHHRTSTSGSSLSVVFAKKECRFGKQCLRKDAAHFLQYSHPPGVVQGVTRGSLTPEQPGLPSAQVIRADRPTTPPARMASRAGVSHSRRSSLPSDLGASDSRASNASVSTEASSRTIDSDAELVHVDPKYASRLSLFNILGTSFIEEEYMSVPRSTSTPDMTVVEGDYVKVEPSTSTGTDSRLQTPSREQSASANRRLDMSPQTEQLLNQIDQHLNGAPTKAEQRRSPKTVRRRGSRASTDPVRSPDMASRKHGPWRASATDHKP